MASVDLQEKANFARLSRLLVDKGTEALRNTLDAIHSPANLSAALNTNITSLRKLKPRVINDTQWDLLFPPSGNPPDSKIFDVTLLTVLLRNICGLPRPVTGWDRMPNKGDITMSANIARVKLFRNEVYAHVSSTRVDNATFKDLWQKISQALVDLKIPQQEINDLKTGLLGPVEKNYVQIITEWVSKDEDCKNMLEDLTTNVKLIQKQIIQSNLHQQHIQQSMEHLEQITEENRSRQSQSEDLLLQALAKHNFKSKIERKAKSFHPGTRDWLLKNVENWFTTEDESRLLLITAGPGFGKSVFAAKVCEIFKEKENLAACHFCDFSSSNLRDPTLMLQSLASQMCENVPGFRDKLLDQLKRPHNVGSLNDAFQIYFQNPLDELEVEPRLIVIDGLDESATDDKSDMVKLIADHFPDIPKCVKVVVTSRPEISIVRLSCAKTITIDASNNDNGSDLLEYLKACLSSLAARDLVNPSTEIHNNNSYAKVLPAIVTKCEGSFLYAFHVQDELCKREDLDRITLEDIMSFLPEGMGSVYKKYFHRLEMELEAAMKKKPDLFKLLEMLVAVEIRLPLAFLSRAFDLALDRRETVKVIEKVNDAVSCLLFVLDDEVTVFHKSVYDWLLASGYKYHEYTVEVSDGKERLWRVCEKIFEEIRRDVSSGNELKLTKDVKHALDYGHKYLLACEKKATFSWLVDMVIIHVLSTVHPKSLYHLISMLEDVLRHDMAINLPLRQKMSWHLIEIRYLENYVRSRTSGERRFPYLLAVLDHSPDGCFTDDEKKDAEKLLEKVPQCVKRNAVGVKMLNRLLAKLFPFPITAFGVSSSKTKAAVALSDGTICVLRLPDLVELWQYSCGNCDIPCCTFAPDESFILYGELETVLSIAEKKKVSFFNGIVEKFRSCSFSLRGKKLVTNDSSTTELKLWDVDRRCLLTVLCAGDWLPFCRFSNTGPFIIAYQKCTSHEPYCVWNSITLQRVDQRSLSDTKHKKRGGLLKSERCDRCFRQGRKELIPPKELDKLTGIYNGVDCVIYSFNGLLHVIDSMHFKTLGAWQIFTEIDIDSPRDIDITTIEDDCWLYGDKEKLIVFSTVPPKEDQSCLSRRTRVLWCSFSPDGTRLASCTSDGFINLWNVETSQVYQHFRSNVETLSAACWWSGEYLFIFHLDHEIPILSKYSVNGNLKIETNQKQVVSLCSVVNEFFQEIVDFSSGYLIFKYSGTEPLKVIDINRMEDPKIVILPEIEDTRRIAVSACGSFVLGIRCDMLLIWKRSEGRSAQYKVSVRYPLNPRHYQQCYCISNDSKHVVLSTYESFAVVNVKTGVRTHGIEIEWLSAAANPAKVFCTNSSVILVLPNLIQIYDLDSGECLGSSFQRNLTNDLVTRSKLSPKGNILAVPRRTGHVEFFQLCISECSSTFNGLKNNKRMGNINTSDSGIVPLIKKPKVE